MIKKFQFPPGINRESTQFGASGSWYKCNNMRFRGGVPETIGGWSRLESHELEGFGRACHSTKSFEGYRYRWVGTNEKFYVITSNGVVDVSPDRIAAVSLGANPFVVAAGIVTVTDGTAGVAVGDWVTFEGATTTVGTTNAIPAATINRNGGWQVTSVGAGTYTFDSGLTPVPTGGGGGGGSGIKAHHKVKPGNLTVSTGSGWGVGYWGGDDFTPTEYEMENTAITIASTTQFDVNVSGESLPSSPSALAAGDSIYITGLDTSSTLDGLDLSLLNNNWWEVQSVGGSDTIRCNLPYTLASTSGATGGGNNGKYYRFDVSATPSPGQVDGATRGWDVESSLSQETGETRRVYMDNYGEDLMFANSGGTIYYYDLSANTSSGVPQTGATKIAAALDSFTGNADPPHKVSSFLVSKKDGHCVALGCNDVGASASDEQNSLLVRWSDQNNPFDWLPTPTNTSGGQVLRVGSEIIGGVSTKDEVVIFTDSGVYSMRFVGPPNVFSFTLITEGVGIVSAASAANAANAVFFMADNAFYVYQGSVSILQSSVAKYVFDDFNYDQKEKCFAAVNSAFGEVTWFYPTADSFEPNRYVTLDYDENVWSMGDLDMGSLAQDSGDLVENKYNRTAWRDAAVFDAPWSTYVTQYKSNAGSAPDVTKCGIMLHETGSSANNMALDSYIETGDISIADGDAFSFYSRIIPDIRLFDVGSGAGSRTVDIDLINKDFPGSAITGTTSKQIDFETASAEDPCDYTYSPTGNGSAVRGRARAIRMKISASASDYKWRMGDMRIDLQPDGRR